MPRESAERQKKELSLLLKKEFSCGAGRTELGDTDHRELEIEGRK